MFSDEKSTYSLPAMKPLNLSAILLFGIIQALSAFDTVKVSNERFKVAHVEPDVTPPSTDLPLFFTRRDEAIRNERSEIRKRTDPKDVLRMRQVYFRYALHPIRVTDKVTGIVYEVQSDRRTITATKPDGTLIWKFDPFVDSKLEPYRMKHPFIVYFGSSKNQSNVKETGPAISFNSSQFGVIELGPGKFHWGGQD
jgi:hypothetical protein